MLNAAKFTFLGCRRRRNSAAADGSRKRVRLHAAVNRPRDADEEERNGRRNWANIRPLSTATFRW